MKIGNHFSVCRMALVFGYSFKERRKLAGEQQRLRSQLQQLAFKYEDVPRQRTTHHGSGHLVPEEFWRRHEVFKEKRHRIGWFAEVSGI
jgi:hypothetical protein